MASTVQLCYTQGVLQVLASNGLAAYFSSKQYDYFLCCEVVKSSLGRRVFWNLTESDCPCLRIFKVVDGEGVWGKGVLYVFCYTGAVYNILGSLTFSKTDFLCKISPRKCIK